jgi:acyl CoA:acetate/3-ketoacid CoA transferase
MSRTSKLMTPEAAAALIPDGAVITVSAASALGCPDRMLRAIGERFEREGHPRDLTSLHPIGAGDMYGVPGMDHLAKPGLLKTVIAGSYPSGPSSLPSPAIWRMIGEDEVAAFNVPSGVLFDMHRDVAARRPGVLTKVGLDTFVDPRRQGCRMNERAREFGDLVRLVEFGGEEWLHFRNVPPNVAIVRGTTADEAGNVSMEHEGAYLGVIDQALATRNNGGIVIAQVKRITTAGSIPTQRVHLPSTLVDVIILDPDQAQTCQTPYDPAISGEVRRPRESFGATPFSADLVIARRAAMELRRGMAVNLGFGISALIPGVLLDEGHAGAVTWAIEQGAVGGIPLTGFAFGCAVNADAIMPSPQQFTYFQGAGFDCAMLSFMEVDADGSVNVSRLAAKPHVTAGCGGFVDITAHARKIVFSGYFTAGGLDLRTGDGRLTIVKEGRFRKFAPEIEHVTFSGRRGRAQAQDVTYVTERCVMELTPDGLTVIEVAPGIDLERDVLGQAGFPLRVSPALRPMAASLFHPERLGLVLEDKPTAVARAAA